MPRRRDVNALPAQTEKSFQADVLEAARLLGWRAYHTHDSRHSESGFPDLVLVRRPRVIFAELKSERGAVSDDQQAWIDDLKASRQEVYVWRPSDWDALVEVLKR